MIHDFILLDFCKTPTSFVKGIINVAFVRYYDNWMRKRKGQAWLNYKEDEAIRRTNALLR